MEMLRIFDTHIENQKSTREIQDGELGPGYRGYFYTNVAMSREGIALGWDGFWRVIVSRFLKLVRGSIHPPPCPPENIGIEKNVCKW